MSVVIPLYNGSRFIEATIASVLHQTHRQLHVIVVDDGSTDDGPTLVANIDDARITLLSVANGGVARARNVGLAAVSAKSDLIAFLDQDDLWPADFLVRTVTALGDRRELAGAAVLIEFVNDQGQPIDCGSHAAWMRSRRSFRGARPLRVEPHADIELDQNLMSNLLCPPGAVLLRREHLERIGGFDLGFTVADDWDLMLRVLRIGPIALVAGAPMGYRRHGGSTSQLTTHNTVETRRVWARAYFNSAPSAVPQAALGRAWRAHHRAAAKAKLGAARTALRDRRRLRAALLLVDAAAQSALYRPLRRWAR